MSNQTINSFWIEGPLNQHHWLTAQSFLQAGHEFVIWTYQDDIREKLPEGTIIRNAREIMPESEIFTYKHMSERMKWGGCAERLKAELLYELGGWHVDMDVSCLRYFDFDAEYVLRPHFYGAVGNIIKCPPKSPLADTYRKWIIEKIDENNQDWELSFRGLCNGVKELELEHYIVGEEVFGRDDREWWVFLDNRGIVPDSRKYAIHWCAALGWYQDYQDGSFYDSLIQKHCADAPVLIPRPEVEHRFDSTKVG